MTNESTIKKASSLKAIISIVLVILIAGVGYTVYNKNSSDDLDIKSNVKSNVKSSGVNGGNLIKNVADVEEVILKWVEANPEIIIDSVIKMQQKSAQDQLANAQKGISSKQDDLLNDKTDPSHSPKGFDVSIVEFFDYNCGYCRKAQATVDKLLKQDKKVRVVFKEFPILGQDSIDLAKVALAVNMIDEKLYLEFHDALMKSSVRKKDGAIKIAESLGIDTAQLLKTLEDKNSNIEDKIASNKELASSIGITGTPAFIIGDSLVPGALDISSLKEKISAERKK
ncbi:MAG: protein-disulfide isomerase [Rickettsiales bacterium]|jgi:protein-disulfide isomerase